ncbi:hypothetical protein BpHYR1_007214 [Brachionus plicatilis]|uniref:Uncharacterized protein n=1 Tax=Brachionus plicatilis TaxID=10195 RepID=A0A3M7SQ62_BRAPC|nr:hypothetical protein BpHYR1_007214 [Brachionus plicatilis]
MAAKFSVLFLLVLGTVQTAIDAAKNFLNREQDRLDGRDLYKFFTADFIWPPKWPSVLSLAVHLAVRLCFGRPTQRSKFLAAGLAALFWPRSDRSCLAAAQHYFRLAAIGSVIINNSWCIYKNRQNQRKTFKNYWKNTLLLYKTQNGLNYSHGQV